MALQVWLPLTKDLRNQGLSDVTVTNNGATFNSAGKLGGSYDLTSGSITLSNLPNPSEISIAFWFKRTANTGTRQFMFTAWTGVTCELTTDGKPTFAVNKNNYPTITGNAITTSTGWIHYCGTFSTTQGMKLYINGSLVASNSNTAAIVWGTTSGQIGKYGGYASMSAQMNDFRIYDHCLSPMEVKELSKGLILHYPLNDNSIQQMNNCYVYPRFETSSSSGGWSHWGRSGASGSNGQTTDSNYIFRSGQTYSHWVANAASATGEYLLYQSPAFEGGSRSLQCICKETNGKIIDESIVFPNWNARSGGAVLNKWTSITSLGNGFYLCKCEDIQQDGSNDLVGFYVRPGYKVYFSEAYLENDRECCSDIFYPTNIIYDTSGFCNNGTAVGTFTISSDTPKYSVSQVFASGNNYIDCGASRDVLPTDGLTVSLWINYSTWGNPISCTEGGGWNFENSSGIQFPVYVAGVGYKVAKSGIATSTLQNGWHMLTGTFDKTNVKIYIDGVLKATTATDSTNEIGYAANHCYVGAEAAGSTSITSAALVGKLSDVRIYATALSASDVKSLYQNCATIDPDGTIRGKIR